jgi:membrane protease YdiL (CAAX protease family)
MRAVTLLVMVSAAFDPERRRWTGTVTGLLGLLLFANVMSNRVIPDWAYVPWNLAVAAAVFLTGLHVVRHEEMGFTRWRRGLAWGLTLLVITGAFLLAAVSMPAFHDMYRDRRVTGGVATWLYQAFVRIPLGTAVLEETAFRAVLPAVLARRFTLLRATTLASLAFGLWHVLPAIGLNRVNPAMTKLFGTGAGGVAAAVVFAVAGTLIAGLWLCWLRYRSGSILTTMLAHVASNSLAYTIARFVN